jgi:hypothetical protein
MIEIEKGHPIPERTIGVNAGRPPVIGHDARNLLDVMEVGDSIKVLGSFAKNTLYVFLSREGKRLDKKFRSADEVGGIRIWRAE